MAWLLRVLGSLLLVGGVVVVIVALRHLPEALPSGTPAHIVHVVDYYEEPPRARFLHVLDASLLPFGSVAVGEAGAPPVDPEFFLIPMVDEAHPLKRQMERHARALRGGDPEAEARWEALVGSPPDWTGVQLLALTDATHTWSQERAISVETHAVEGVARPADEALSPAVLASLAGAVTGFDPAHAVVLSIGEVPPEREALTVTVGLGALAAVLGLATFVATFWARRPGWLH